MRNIYKKEQKKMKSYIKLRMSDINSKDLKRQKELKKNKNDNS